MIQVNQVKKEIKLLEPHEKSFGSIKDLFFI